MKKMLRIRLDELGLGSVIIIDGKEEIDIAKYTTGISIENHPGEPSIVTLQLMPMDLEMDLPAELKLLVDETSKEPDDDTA